VEGCIALGKGYDVTSNDVTSSESACKEFYPWILSKIIETGNDVWLTIK